MAPCSALAVAVLLKCTAVVPDLLRPSDIFMFELDIIIYHDLFDYVFVIVNVCLVLVAVSPLLVDCWSATVPQPTFHRAGDDTGNQRCSYEAMIDLRKVGMFEKGMPG